MPIEPVWIGIFVAFFAGSLPIIRLIKQELVKYIDHKFNEINKKSISKGSHILSIHKSLHELEDYIDSKNDKINFSFSSGIVIIACLLLTYIDLGQSINQIVFIILYIAVPFYSVMTTPLLLDYALNRKPKN